MRKLCLLISLILICACNKDEDNNKEINVRKEYRIAVVLPQDGTSGNDWHKPIDWSLENLNKALMAERQIKVTAEWYDENQSDLESLFKTLAQREDICAIIGPLYSRNANIAAQQCYATKKMLIPATVSSESIMRKYASDKGFLWCLTENDISQCEVLLTRAMQKGARKVSLLTSDDEYGTTFMDWFAFQAQELGLQTGSIKQYNEQDVTEKMNSLLNEDSDCLICVPRTKDITILMNECRRNRTSLRPFLLFSDVAFITPKDITFEGMEGITQTHNPQSGFPLAYEARFGDAPDYGGAHFYDAVTLAGLAILQADLSSETNFNSSLRKIADGDDKEINTASETGIYRAVQSLTSGQHPHITGASGNLYFADKVYTNVTHSVFCHWQVYNGKHLILEYNTSDDSKRTNASMANWNWKVTQTQTFDDKIQISYPDRAELYAVIIAAAQGWENYRHQANAYAMYQLLKKNGMDDSHILLISEDDIANNASNPHSGFILSPFSEENLYNGIKVDYHPSKLKFRELLSAFNQDGDFHPGKEDNLFVYWAGHGVETGPKWLNETIPAYQVADFFGQLSFRKLFLAMETCYAGVVGKACADKKIKGMLCMTAANDQETSKASVTGLAEQIWISNSFTDKLLLELTSRGKDASIYSLYHEVYNATIGSHVSVYNAGNFGNLYTSPINEFLYP
ncbi:C13 family peptidase [Bacteroides sp.]